MNDKFYLKLNCAYCGLPSDIYYTKMCKSYDFICQQSNSPESDGMPGCYGCRKINFITTDFNVKKVEDTSEEDAVQAFEMTAIGNKTLATIRKEAKRYLKELKKRTSK